MTSWHKNPALYAGLAGAASFAVPTYAHAVEIFGTNVPMSEVSFAFVGGCVSGALVASGVSIVTNYVLEARAERDEAAHMFENQARHNKGQVASHSAAAAAPTHSTVHQAPAHAAQSAPAPAHAAQTTSAGAHAAQAAPVRAHGKRFKQSEPEFYGRHSAEARAVREWEQTGAIRVQKTGASHMAASKEVASMTGAWDAFASDTNDYADIADAYVQKMTLAERMSSRAKGVANVLSERLNINKMDGVPVIERASNSAYGVDASWWLAPEDDNFSVNTPAAAPVASSAVAQAYAPAPTPAVSPATAPAATPTSVASYTQAAQEVFDWDSAPTNPNAPKVTVSEATPQQQDLWNTALLAMDERFAERIALGPDGMAYDFKDDIGDIETLDEPEGLEPVTTFMTFKPTAGHPEVQDTSSYVDLLIDQEFAQNESVSARKSVRGVMRNYLKVVDGTGALNAVRKAPKHMAASMAPLAFAQ